MDGDFGHSLSKARASFIYLFFNYSVSFIGGHVYTHEELFYSDPFFFLERANMAVVGDTLLHAAPKTASLIHISWLGKMNPF